MKIGFITRHCCIRVLKEAAVLRYDIHLFTNSLPAETSFFKTINYYENWQQLADEIRRNKDIDIWHVHNEPSYPVTLIREMLPKAKIVLDCHDLNGWRVIEGKTLWHDRRIPWYEEELALDCADALVVPSETAKQETKKYVDKQTIVIPPATPSAEFRVNMNNVYGGLVSQGGHTLPNNNLESWRDYTELYKRLKPKTKIIACSPSFNWEKGGNSILKHYENLGVECRRFAYVDLLNFITQCTWNLVGNLKGRIWNITAANKFFDAVAAGTPSVVINCKEAEKLVEKYDCGIVIKEPEELFDRWEEHREKRKNLIMNRKHLCMEKFIPRLEKLYKKLKRE